MNNILALMCGIDIPIPECQLVLHQPTMKEIAYIGEDDFFTGIQTFCVNKNLLSQDKVNLDDISNFQIFMMIMQDKTTTEKKQAVLALCSLLFPKKRVVFSPRAITFMEDDLETIMVDENNFDFLQEVIKDVFCVRSDTSQGFNPQSEKAKEIAAKLMRARQRVAEQHGADRTSAFVQYISVLTIGINSMSLMDCINLTMFQLYDLIERYGLHTNWNLDIQSRLAGGKPDSKPDNWMKNIH